MLCYGVIVKLADFVTPAAVAEIAGLSLAVTATVLIVKVTEFLPAGTITGPATVAFESLDVTFTVSFAAAGAVNVTVPVVEVPPTTEVGVIWSE